MKRIYWLSALVILVWACQDDQIVLQEDNGVAGNKEAKVRMLSETVSCGDAVTHPLMVNTTGVGNVIVSVGEVGLEVTYDLTSGEWFLLKAEAFAGDCSQLPDPFPYSQDFPFDNEVRSFTFSIPWDNLPECGCVDATAIVAKFNSQSSQIESYPAAIRANYCKCVPPPPDTVECDETLLLPIPVGDELQGVASVQSSLTGLKILYDLTTSEWFLLNVLIEAGDCTEPVSGGKTIDRVYLQDDEVRLDSVSIPADSLPECGCFHSAVTIGRFNAVSQLETKVVNLNAHYCLCEEPGGKLRTQTQGGWGAEPNGNNPGTYLHSNFDAAFPNDLVVGCTYTLTFTNAQAITNFLPQGGKAKALTTSYTNPPDLKNVLAGQVVALKLNVSFDAFDENFSEADANLGDAKVTTGIFEGWTVYAVLAEAEKALGGCTSQHSSSDLNDALSAINGSWTDGRMATDYISF